MNSYFEKESAMATENGLYKDGDFIINFGDCDRGERRCETEMKPFLSIAKQRLEMK
jgi:mannan polymerase II complex MNN11 subunit